LLLGSLRLRFLRRWLGLLFWLLRLLLLATLRLRRRLLLLGRRCFGLLFGLLLAAARRCSAQFYLHEVLAHLHSVFLVDQKLLDGASLGGVDGHVDLEHV
jgi:hypothetical protein